jgi:hypothetical protein
MIIQQASMHPWQAGYRKKRSIAMIWTLGRWQHRTAHILAMLPEFTMRSGAVPVQPWRPLKCAVNALNCGQSWWSKAGQGAVVFLDHIVWRDHGTAEIQIHTPEQYLRMLILFAR